MGCSHIGYDPHSGKRNGAELCNLAKAPHAHLHHAHLCFGSHRKKGHGKTDFIIEILLRSGHMETGAEDGRNHILGGSFPVGTGDADYGHLKTHPVEMGQIFQPLLCVFHQKNGYMGIYILPVGSIRNHHCRCPGKNRSFQKFMTVEIFTNESDEKFAPGNGTGIGTYPLHKGVLSLLQKRCSCGFFDFLQCK